MALPSLSALRGLCQLPTSLRPALTLLKQCSYSTGHLHILVEPLDEPAGVSLLTLSRPEAKNAIGRQLLSELVEAINILRLERSTRCVIVRSSVPAFFCVGADLKERAAMTHNETTEFIATLGQAFTALQSLPMPTIAMVEGLALGGGAELALACDLRVVSTSANFAFPETRLGVIPGAGGTQRLPRLVGVSRAKDLIFTARRVSADEAVQLGLAERLFTDADMFEKTLGLARLIMKSAPLSLQMAKTAISTGVDAELATGLKVEEACYAQLLKTKDRLEGLKSFAEKRPAVYVGE